MAAMTETPATGAAPRPATVPEKPTVDGLEAKWAAVWAEQGTYSFDRTASREQVYSIDTPPPTASGSLHVGHVFSYTHTDCVARYQRMRGKVVFYPMGWDDNGLPTERRVQNYYGVRCDPALPYDPDFTPPAKPAKNDRDFVHVSRENFIELCLRLTTEDEHAFEELWRRLGLSVDWSQSYQTIDDGSRATAQRAFLRALARGDAYAADAPTLWDVTFRTAVAQAELEDRERPGAYHRLAFPRTAGGAVSAGDDGGTSAGEASTEAAAGSPGAGSTGERDAAPADAVIIETTRPELVPACVALVAHPDDERYADLVGRTVRTPVFGVEVPVLAHRLAEPDKGTGIAMICTFGDVTDVTWWRELQLPTRSVLGRDGRFARETPAWLAEPAAQEAYTQLAGKTVHSARQTMLDLLGQTGALLGEPRPISHAVKFFEKGDKPLEIVTSRQWYLKNGGRDHGDGALRSRLLGRGEALTWYPPHMWHRYENWVEGLNSDWLISRQRFFGVPFPVWYRLDAAGEPDVDHPILPAETELPIDPSSDTPAGYTAEQRGEPGGFIGDPDVMDTWATSSLTPQIAGGWERDNDLFSRVFPYDLRPQGHDIIRTWLFSTVVRSDAEHDSLPWQRAAISGWILDPDRKKMSKSKGNVVTPIDLLEQHGSDGVRYWAASGRPGVDTAFDAGQMKIGRRLAMKLLNVSRFILGFTPDSAVTPAEVREPLDQAVLGRLADVVETATAAFDGYDYTRALEAAEQFFWTFCDDYVELVKDRCHNGGGPGRASALAALREALSVQLRLFAPFLPFATEEAWSWWQEGSVHRQPWPEATALRAAADGADATTLTVVGRALAGVRRAKSEAKVSQRTEVNRVVVAAPPEHLALVAAAAEDLRAAGRIDALELGGDASEVEVREVSLTSS